MLKKGLFAIKLVSNLQKDNVIYRRINYLSIIIILVIIITMLLTIIIIIIIIINNQFCLTRVTHNSPRLTVYDWLESSVGSVNCTIIAEAMGLNPIQARILFRLTCK